MRLRNYLAEIIGTFALVFCGTGAIILDQEFGGQVTNFGIASAFCLIVIAMILLLGKISGSHLNPAVTIAFSLAKLFPTRFIAPYIISQIVGGVLASALLKYLFPTNKFLGATMPSGSAMPSFILEIVLTMILIMVIFYFSIILKKRILAAIVIGLTVGVEAFFGGPISGASMNPARSFAPAIISNHTEHLWIYIFAPIIGALLGVIFYHYLIKRKHDSFH